MTDAHDITIAIPYYQGLDYLRRAVQSVRLQTASVQEIVLCDDSPDGEAASVVALWPGRIRYFRNPQRLGIVGNWNRCLGEVKTPLAVLLNADDMLMPDYAATMLDAAERYPDATGIFCEAVTMNEQNRRIFSLADFTKRFLWPQGIRREQRIEGEAGLKSLLRGDYIFCPSMCYRLAKLGSERFDVRWSQVLDLDLFCRLILAGHHWVGLRRKCFAFRRHPQSHTKMMEKDFTRFREEVACTNVLSDKAEAQGWLKAAHVGRAHRLIKLHFLFELLGKLLHGNVTDARQMARAYKLVFGVPSVAHPEI